VGEGSAAVLVVAVGWYVEVVAVDEGRGGPGGWGEDRHVLVVPGGGEGPEGVEASAQGEVDGSVDGDQAWGPLAEFGRWPVGACCPVIQARRELDTVPDEEVADDVDHGSEEAEEFLGFLGEVVGEDAFGAFDGPHLAGGCGVEEVPPAGEGAEIPVEPEICHGVRLGGCHVLADGGIAADSGGGDSGDRRSPACCSIG